MKMKFKIEKNIPIPTQKNRRTSHYPFNDMEIGDSFVVEKIRPLTLYYAANRWAKKYENNLDPDLCDSIVNKISNYEDSCNEVIEQLDCG